MSTAPIDPSSSLASEQEAMGALLQLLQHEQDRMIEANIDGMPGLLEQKTGLVTQLSALARGRHGLLAQAGFDASESGMRAWVAKHEMQQTQWSALLVLGAQAKEINRINGMLIARHLVRSQSALNVLQGKSQHGTFYGPNGQSTGPGMGRGLAIG